jgi:hypothetical protein
MCQSPAIPQVMGPTDISDMSSTPSSNQTLTVLNLIADGSNWSMYSERVMNYLTSKGLKRHVQGTARRPADLIKRNREYYRWGIYHLWMTKSSKKWEGTGQIRTKAGFHSWSFL